MRFAYLSLALTAAALTVAAPPDPSSGGVSRAHVLQQARASDAASYGDTFDWQRGSPLDFLAALKQRSYLYSVHGVHVGWLRDTDIGPLLTLVASEEPCAHVNMTISSQLPTPGTRSTIGDQAVFLLDGVRQRRFPPTLNSFSYTPSRRAEVITWAARAVKSK